MSTLSAGGKALAFASGATLALLAVGALSKARQAHNDRAVGRAAVATYGDPRAWSDDHLCVPMDVVRKHGYR